MEEIFVSRMVFENDPEHYIALMDKNERLIAVVGPMNDPNNLEQAHRMRLALELISEIPTDLLEEIRSRQFTSQERAEILRLLRVAWYDANRLNRVPVRHVGLKDTPEP